MKAVILALGLVASACRGEAPAEPGSPTAPRPDLYACDGCEAALERAPETLSPTAVMAGPDEPGERMTVRGTVFRPDGRTPAEDVVIYAYQTNAEGAYGNGSNESEWSRRHGRLRAWVRTGPDGRYEFDTIKPAPYPDLGEPAHVHLIVAEPNRPPYWIDDIVFAGEHLVDDAYRQEREERGGPGIVTLDRTAEGRWIAQRDIVLERHPN